MLGTRTTGLLVGLLVLLHYGLAIDGIRSKCTTFDEIAHQTAGYSYWRTKDYRLNPENGNLPQRLAALPLLGGDYVWPGPDHPSWRRSDVWGVGHSFYYELGNDLDAMLLRGRAAMALLSAALAILVFAWSRRLFGAAGGLVSLAAYALSPTMLAHAPLMTSDVALALLLLAATGCLWHQLHRPSPVTAGGGALVLGALAVAKMSAVLIVPIGLSLFAIRMLRGSPLAVARPGRSLDRRHHVALAALGVFAFDFLVAGAIVWTSYGLRYSAFRDAGGQERFYEDRDRVQGGDDPVLATVDLARRARLLPEAWLEGLAVVRHKSEKRSSFMNGQHSGTGFRTFFPYAFLVKTPIPVFFLLLLGCGAAVSRWKGSKGPLGSGSGSRIGPDLYRMSPLFVLLLAYGAFALTARLNIGHRHLLPIYPVLFILLGASVRLFRGRMAALLVAVPLVVLASESLWIRPHYLAYFNQLAGGPKDGYRRLVDSSLDWGQDLPDLARWLRTSGRAAPGAPVYLSYFGNGSPRYYGIDARELPFYGTRDRTILPLALEGGTYCVSATMLQSVYLAASGPWSTAHEERYQTLRQMVSGLDQPGGLEALERQHGRREVAGVIRAFREYRLGRLTAYLRQREPDAQVGYSILIYRLTDDEIREAVAGPPAELVEAAADPDPPGR